MPGIFALGNDGDTCARISDDLKNNPVWRLSPTDKAWVEYFQHGRSTANQPAIDAAAVCRHLDGGLGDKLFDYYRDDWDESGAQNSLMRPH